MKLTSEQKEKIIELRKLNIRYCSITTAMDLSIDSVTHFCKIQEVDGYGREHKKPKEVKSLPKTYCSTECKKRLGSEKSGIVSARMLLLWDRV